MLGWFIFVHAVTLVLRNLISVFRVFWAPAFLSFAFFLLFLQFSGLGEAYVSGLTDSLGWGEKIGIPDGAILKFFFPWYFVLIVINAILTAWAVTVWHRYILLGEFSFGLIPPLNFARIMGYILRAFLLGAITLLLFFPVMFIFFGVFEIVGQFGFLLGLLAAVVPVVLFSMVVLRWSLILPAYAVGNPISLSESWLAWRKLQKPNSTIIGLIVANSVAQWLLGILVDSLDHVPIYQGVIEVIAQAFVAVLNITVLTTLYGYVVEDRPLA